MKLPVLKTESYMIPSEKIAEEGVRLGLPKEHARNIMRDYSAIKRSGNVMKIVVGDMANNLTGTTFEDGKLALELGLPKDYRFNGGLLGSLALRQALPVLDTTGEKFISDANNVINDLYRRLNFNPQTADERFTGYLTAAHITPQETTITSVGDVYAWVNGELVAGEEKQVDTKKGLLVDNLESVLNLEEGRRALAIIYMVEQFAADGHLDSSIAYPLMAELIRNLNSTTSPDRQTFYRPVDNLITRWQIINLQNPSSPDHPWSYGAIDGTSTPNESVKTIKIPTGDIDELVIHTDGSKAREKSLGARSIRDLIAVNSTYGEQSIVALRRIK